jgi:hypothetical protein
MKCERTSLGFSSLGSVFAIDLSALLDQVAEPRAGGE